MNVAVLKKNKARERSSSSRGFVVLLGVAVKAFRDLVTLIRKKLTKTSEQGFGSALI